MFSAVVSFLATGASLFFAIAVFIRDRTRAPETLFLAAVLLLVALATLDDALAHARAYDLAPWAFGWLSYAAPVFIGPFIWLHIVAVSDPASASIRRVKTHLIGAAALLLPLVPWMLLPPAARWAIETGEVDTRLASQGGLTLATGGLALLLLATLAQQLAYLVGSAQRSRAIVSSHRRHGSFALFCTATLAFVVFAIGVGAQLMGMSSAFAGTFVNATVLFCIYGLALYAIIIPPDPLVAAIGTTTKYAKSALTEADRERLMRKLETAITAQGLSRDPGITLAKLAASVGCSPQDASQTLNIMANGFHEWIGRHRIRDVQAQLRADPQRSLLDVAYGAGFNAKSTFYDAFVRFTGQTPSVWRSALLKENDAKPSGRAGSDDGKTTVRQT